MAVEKTSHKAVLWAILLVVGLLSVLPFVWIVAGSFKPDGQIKDGYISPNYTFEESETRGDGSVVKTTKHLTLSNYKVIFSSLSGLPTYYFNTLYFCCPLQGFFN